MSQRFARSIQTTHIPCGVAPAKSKGSSMLNPILNCCMRKYDIIIREYFIKTENLLSCYDYFIRKNDCERVQYYTTSFHTVWL